MGVLKRQKEKRDPRLQRTISREKKIVSWKFFKISRTMKNNYLTTAAAQWSYFGILQSILQYTDVFKARVKMDLVYIRQIFYPYGLILDTRKNLNSNTIEIL